jgi:hypothetical protein
MKQMKMPCDLLLGRKTFDNFASFWPQHSDIWRAVKTATKYVASNTMTSHQWQPSVFLKPRAFDLACITETTPVKP